MKESSRTPVASTSLAADLMIYDTSESVCGVLAKTAWKVRALKVCRLFVLIILVVVLTLDSLPLDYGLNYQLTLRAFDIPVQG